MGALTQTNLHNYTDQIAARVRAELANFESQFLGRTVAPLRDLLETAGDPEAEDVLGAKATLFDRAGLSASAAANLTAVLSRTQSRSLAQALIDYVTSADGGDYATFRAGLEAVTALVDPLAAELFRELGGEGMFTDTAGLVNSVFSPVYACVRPDRVYTGADGALVDDTTDAQDVGAADVALFGSDDFTLYVGSRRKFTQIIVGLSTLASATITPTFKYWNGSSWATLTVTDNAVGFTKNDTISFTAPADWVPGNEDAGGNALADKAKLYYVRIARTADALVTPPVGTCISLVPALIYRSGSAHLGVPQPPLAIARITAANTIVVESIADPDDARFTIPGEAALVLRALTPFGATLTPTVSYNDEDDVASTQAQGAWASPAALDSVAVDLAAADSGLKSVLTTGWVVTVSSSGLGVFAVEVNALRSPAL